MPSAVFADDRAIVVGHDAVVRRLQAPDAFEDTPKSRIDDGEIELGDRFWPVEDLIGAVLRHVHRVALRHSGFAGFDSIVLTHPDRWSERRKGVLRRAAERAGFGADRLRLASNRSPRPGITSTAGTTSAVTNACVCSTSEQARATSRCSSATVAAASP